jgi:hypothetical protein
MKVHELIVMLSKCDPNASVVFSPPLGCDSDTDVEVVKVDAGIVVLTVAEDDGE